MVNDSDTEVRQLTFTSKAAEFSDFSNYDEKSNTYATKPAMTPAPVVLNLSVPAHSSQDAHFKTCTTTPPPGGSYEFDVTPADEQGFTWVTGYRGRICFGFGC